MENFTPKLSISFSILNLKVKTVTVTSIMIYSFCLLFQSTWLLVGMVVEVVRMVGAIQII